MSADEAAAFEAQPNFRLILALRSWDERAKDPEAQPEGLRSYRERLGAHLESNAREKPPC